MNEYEQVVKEAELALSNGEYKKCINLLNPIFEDFQVSTQEGVNIRMMLITAFSGINKKDKSVELCKQLTKSKYSYIREDAKSLIQILNSPNLEIPDDWNIEIENSSISKEFKSITPQNKISKTTKQYINTFDLPTGETKPFQKGFIFFTFLLSILMLFLLSGCVKVESNLDLREIESINFNLNISTKYVNKLPWQLNFENQIQDISTSKEISSNNNNFVLKKEGLGIKKIDLYINQILNIASNSIGTDLKNIKINHFEENYFIGKRYFFNIELDLTNLKNIDELEIFINIINPSKVSIPKENKYINLVDKTIKWEILQGKINQIEFSYWNWNKLLLWTFIILLLITFAYFIRNKRYELGSNLPQLPS